MEEIEQKDIRVLLPLLLEEPQQFRESFLEFHTYDQKELFLTLSYEERKALYACLEPSEMAVVFEQVEHDTGDVEDYLLEMDKLYASRMLSSMSIDDAVDVLKRLSADGARSYLRLMPKDTVYEIMDLFQYPDQTAGALMTTAYIAISATENVAEALVSLKEQAMDAEMINYAYVVDIYDRLLGIVSLRDLLSNTDDTLIPDIMIDRIISAKALDTQDQVVQLIRAYDLVAIPVVTDDGTLLGIVTVDDMIDVMDEEAISDYSELAGVDVDEDPETIFHSLGTRLWRLAGLLGLSLLTALILFQFESIFEKYGVLAAFLIFISGTAGNIATQSLAVTLRKMAVRGTDSPLSYLLNELLIGAMAGLVVGSLAGLAIGLVSQMAGIALVVGLSIGIAMFLSVLIGSGLPLLLTSFGLKTVSLSAPLMRGLTDLVSIIVYLIVANLLL